MHRRVSDLSLSLTADEVLAGQGIDRSRASRRLVAAAACAADEAQALLHPASLFTTAQRIGLEDQRVTFQGGWFEGPLVARAMAGADQLTMVIGSIGAALEDRVDELMSANPLVALALDGAGTAALRKLSEAVSYLVCEEARAGQRSLGMRVYPGQEGWPLEQQRQIFSLLPAHSIGVRLNERCLMFPRKSVSFVLPAGEGLVDRVRPCDLCSKRHRCAWRRPSRGSSGLATPLPGEALADTPD